MSSDDDVTSKLCIFVNEMKAIFIIISKWHVHSRDRERGFKILDMA